MERTKKRTQNLLAKMVASDLPAKEINGACVFPSWPRPASRSNRPDTYLRLPLKCTNSIAHRSRSIHFGYKNHVSIDHRHGFIRGWSVTSASAWDGAQLSSVLDKNNTGSTVWADSAYRSKKNEAWLEKNGYFCDIHQQKPKGRTMSARTSRANARRSKIRAFVEHVFAQQKSRMGLFVRSIGLARARTKIGMANLSDNFTRYVWHQGRRLSA